MQKQSDEKTILVASVAEVQSELENSRRETEAERERNTDVGEELAAVRRELTEWRSSGDYALEAARLD